MRLRASLLSLTFLIASLNQITLLAQDSDSLKLIDRIYNNCSYVYDLQIDGNYAYLAAGYSGLRIIDISDPENIDDIGYLDDLPFEVSSLELYDEVIYLLCSDILSENGFLFAIDVSEPANPIEIASMELKFSEGYFIASGDIFLRNELAFITAYQNGFYIIDISDAENMFTVSHVTNYDKVTAVIADNDFAYVADKYNGVQIYDISDPAAPMKIVELELYTANWYSEMGLAKEGDVLFAVRESMLSRIDISNPQEPFVSDYNIVDIGTQEGYGRRLTVKDDYAYISSGNSGFRIVDISDPDTMLLVSRVDTEGEVSNIVVIDDYLYTAQFPDYWDSIGGGVEVFDISNRYDPKLYSNFIKKEGAIRLQIEGDHALILADGLRIVDISNSTNLQEVGAFTNTIELYNAFAVNDNYAFLTSTHRNRSEWDHAVLKVLDISDYQSPDSVTELRLVDYEMTSVNDLMISGDYAYSAGRRGDDGILLILEIADAFNPRIAGFFTTPELEIEEIDISGEFAYLAGIDFLTIINIENPHQPVEVGCLELDMHFNPTALTIKGDYAYMVTYGPSWTSLLSIIDISDPANPTPVSTYEIDFIFASDISIYNSVAYICKYSEGIELVDISDPEHPFSLGKFDTPGTAVDLTVVNDLIYIADGTNLSVYTFSEDFDGTDINILPRNFHLYAAYPNPFNSSATIKYRLLSASNVELSVYDENGRYVEHLFSGFKTVGSYYCSWNSDYLPSGIYTVRMQAGKHSQSRKLVHLK